MFTKLFLSNPIVKLFMKKKIIYDGKNELAKSV